MNWFETFLATSADAFIEYNQERKYVSINPVAAAWLGLETAEIIGKNNLELIKIYPENGVLKYITSQIEPCLEQVLIAGEKRIAIHEAIASDGSIKIYETAYTPVKESSGNTRVFSVGRDITQHYRWQQQKAAAAERSRLTALTADVGIALTRHPQEILGPCCSAAVHHLDAASTIIWTFNPQENVLELQASAGLSPTPGGPDSRIAFGCGKIGLIAQQQQPLFDNRFAIADFELGDWGLGRGEGERGSEGAGERGSRGEGEQGSEGDEEVKSSLSSLSSPPSPPSIASFAGYPLIVEDRLVGVMAILIYQPLSQGLQEALSSVTNVIALGIERKRAEAELNSARGFLNSVVENLPVGVFAKDAESLKFVLWNKAGETIAGVTSQEAIGKSDYDFLPKDQADAIAAKDREVFTSYQSNPSNFSVQDVAESPIQTPHRGLRILHTRKIPIFDKSGNPQYLLGITEDITERKQVDESVRLYGQIVENMQIGLYVYRLEDINDDRSLRAIASNPATTLFTGVEMADILGMTLDEVFPHQRDKGIPQAFASVIREQKAVELEDIDCGEDGTVIRAFSIKAFPLPNNCVGVAFENITSRKKLELELKLALKQSERSQQLLRTVIDTTPDWIFAKDRHFRYILVNQSFSDSLNLTVEEVLGKDDVEIGFPETEIFGNCQLNISGFRSDESIVLTGEIVHNPDDRATFADGSIHIFDTQKIPLRDAEGNIFAILGFAHDITERHLVQEALRQKTSELEAVFQALPDLYFRLNVNGIILDYLSGSSGDLYVPQEVFLGQQMTEVLPLRVGRQFEQAIQETFAKGDLVTLEYSLRMPQGKQTYEARLLPFGDSQVIILARNITERKQAEAQLREKNQQLELTLQELRKTQTQLIQSEKMSSLGQLVAGIAHEINNPVSFIYGNISHANEYAQSLLHLCSLYQKNYTNPAPEITALAEEIDLDFLISDFPQLMNSMEMGADRIRQIVLSLRNFSRIEESDIKTVDISQGIDSTLLILQHRLKQTATDRNTDRNIEVVKEYGSLPLVECYPGLLNQVLMNIINNAIDALSEMKSDSLEISNFSEGENLDVTAIPLTCNILPCITIRTRLLESNRIAIAIADNGPGMPESVNCRIFDPFFTTKPVGKGTGLGLSISYQIIVEKHGGMLTCISASGSGSEFVIEIPIRQR
ncbi:PAS domain-containing protein [Kamptonema sp. UHCC 0994]|uniref:PAS domain-containing protein n=1 Tax=Kamptonema sp. UHCC 0994 TaxID=3031329 RepID=UPI0023B99E39|nr:PAS domain-containing protein [Kamptonema sp. UHCC 0994]